MIGRKIRVGTGLVAVLTAGMFTFPNNALADYGPSGGDVVGVGSDTLQQLGDFVADGDYTGNPGYNSAKGLNRFISVDATADANTRLAYGTGGLGSPAGSAGVCAPGTGSTKGTGNNNTVHQDAPCTLNPTVVLRAGLAPTQRPNGSGAGFNLLVADTNTTTGKGKGLVDFARASSPRAGGALYDSITVGHDDLKILASTTTNAVPLTKAQLTAIYQCTATKWTDVGGTSGATIVPLAPQLGSGTRTSFLGDIGVANPGACVQNVEENDPEAIDASGDPANAIEPMSTGRLNLFQGKLSTGVSTGQHYFFDPSCPFPPFESSTPAPACTTGAALSPNVSLLTGYTLTRNLYMYFRHADINSTKAFQPGNSLNWVRTMFYNPCATPGSPTCVTVGGVEYGPGGAPYFASAAGQANISASGIIPDYSYNLAGP